MRTSLNNSTTTHLLRPNDMHNDSKKWLSELALAKDEHQFFKDVLEKTALDIIAISYDYNYELKHAINRSEKQVKMLINMVKDHLNKIESTFYDTEKKNIYKFEHHALLKTINSYKKNFYQLKSQLFDITKRAKKEEKTRRLINRKDYPKPVF